MYLPSVFNLFFTFHMIISPLKVNCKVEMFKRIVIIMIFWELGMIAQEIEIFVLKDM